MKNGRDGYSLGIIVPMEWWKEAKGTCPAPLEESSYHENGVRLVLANLPYCEFDLYCEPSTIELEWVDRVNARRDAQRSKFGWKKREFEELGFPDIIEHKYFTVEHEHI